MIDLYPAADVPAPLSLFSTKTTVAALQGFEPSLLACCFGSPEVSLPAFANINKLLNKRENDFYNFSISVSTGSVVTGTLTDIKTGVEHVIVDQTYGDFADVGAVNNRPDIWGFVLQWSKVAIALQYGKYTFNLHVENAFGRELLDVTYPCFHLRPFDCEDAHKTVRIDLDQSGYIDNGFDWENINGSSSPFGQYQIRTYGVLRQILPTTESSIQVDEKRRDQLSQRAIIKNYDLDLRWLSGLSSEKIIYEMMLASKIKLSDYNLDNIRVFNDVAVTYLNVEDQNKPNQMKQEFFTLKFTDHRKTNLKRYN